MSEGNELNDLVLNMLVLLIGLCSMSKTPAFWGVYQHIIADILTCHALLTKSQTMAYELLYA